MKLLQKCTICLAVLSVALLLFAGATLAHEIYLDIAREIEVGQQTEIRLFWGHFPADPDPQSSYFQGLLAGRFYIIEPDGNEIDLTLKAGEDHYFAAFTPRQAGDHWAVFSHNRGVLDWTHSEPQGRQLVAVYAKALLDVHGEDETPAWSRLAGHDLEILPLVDGGHLHSGEEYRAQLLYFGRPLADVPIAWYGPSGQSGEGVTGPGGTFAFIPDEEGPWLVKVSYFDGDRAGEEGGEAYLGARYTATLLLTPHAHDEEEAPAVPLPGGAQNTTNYLYLLLVLLFVLAAGILFMKSKKQAA